MDNLDLSPQQFEEIEKLAGSNCSIEDIALYFGMDTDVLQEAFNAPGSRVKFHYDRGQLLVKAQGYMELYDSAKTGNVTAMQQLEKARAHNKLEQSKKKALLNVERQKLDILQQYIEKHHKDELDPELIIYYEQLDMVRALWQKGHTRNFIHNALLSSYKSLSYYKARKLFDEAINFFYLDSGIQKKAWSNYYADFLDAMAKICFDMGDFNQARLLTKDAAEMRQLNVPDPPKSDDGSGKRVFIYTINPETLGLPKANRAKLAKWIDGLDDISDIGRDRLHLEVMDGKSTGNILNIPIDDVEYIDKEGKDED